MQAASSALFSVGTGEGNVLPFLCPLDFVSLPFHEKDEIIFIQTFLHGVPNVVHQPELPTLALLRRSVLTGGHLLAAAFILGQDTETMCLADVVTDQPQKFQRVGILVKLSPGLEVH